MKHLVVESLIAFTLAASILTVTPGVDTALVLRTVAVGGARPAAFATLGIGLGCLVWGALVSLGLGALLAASAIAFTVLKYAGAAYLLWLGVRLLLRPRQTIAMAGDADFHGKEALIALRRGFLKNMLNPKVGVFYISPLPQFVPAAGERRFVLIPARLHSRRARDALVRGSDRSDGPDGPISRSHEHREVPGSTHRRDLHRVRRKAGAHAPAMTFSIVGVAAHRSHPVML